MKGRVDCRNLKVFTITEIETRRDSFESGTGNYFI